MEVNLIQNWTYLTEQLTNILPVLNRLLECNVISVDEKEEILLPHRTSMQKSDYLFTLLRRKDFIYIGKIVLSILRETGNWNCADALEGISPTGISVPKLLIQKWWPEEKFLINSHQQRKISNSLIVETIKKSLEEDHDNKTVISQKATVSGMGGVGKTTTAIWFAKHYEEDYDNILWIDCGEGSLARSIKELAGDLKIDKDELNLKKMAQQIFLKISSNYKCLLIYDNAECFVGNEGIKDVLPIHNSNIHCLITSRSSIWGDSRAYGKIPTLQLDSFSLEDSVTFLERNLHHVENHESQLKELATLLGHLPLALQIVVATLNSKKHISIADYIQTVKTTYTVVNSKTALDEYERSLSTAMNYSLELIKKEENGITALKILSNFCYICPDNIGSNYFAEIDSTSIDEIEDAIDLLHNHSLVSKVGLKRILVQKDGLSIEKAVQVVSIHRLLQQVIKYNGLKTEKDTLRKILNCPGFIEYKLIPYRFAEIHEDLKEEFFHIRAQLIEQLNLQIMWKDQRYIEAIQLSRLIHEGFRVSDDKTLFIASLYNYAICLWKNGELHAALENFQTIFLSLKDEDLYEARIEYTPEFNIVDITRVTKEQVVANLCIQLENHRDEADNLTIKMKNEVANLMWVRIDCKNNPCNLNALGEFKQLKIRSCTDLMSDNGKREVNQENSYADAFLMDRIKIRYNNNTLVVFPKLRKNLRMKKLKISSGKPEVQVNLSHLPETIEELILQAVEISREIFCLFTLIAKLKLKGFHLSGLEFQDILLSCPQLVDLQAYFENDTTVVKRLLLPPTLKILLLDNVTFEIPTTSLAEIATMLHLNTEEMQKTEMDSEPGIIDEHIVQFGHLLDCIYLYNMKFISEEGESMDHVQLNKICSFETKELLLHSDCYYSFEEIRRVHEIIDCSKLSDTIEILHLSGNMILPVVGDIPLCSVASLKLEFIAVEYTQKLVSGCPNLISLYVRGEDEIGLSPTSALQLKVPSSVRTLFLDNTPFFVSSLRLPTLLLKFRGSYLGQMEAAERIVTSNCVENFLILYDPSYGNPKEPSFNAKMANIILRASLSHYFYNVYFRNKYSTPWNIPGEVLNSEWQYIENRGNGRKARLVPREEYQFLSNLFPEEPYI